MSSRCPQCGARLAEGTTCADHLFRMLMSGGIAHERMAEAFAQFAVSHPLTYSSEALELASSLLGEEEEAEVDTLIDEAASPFCRWWRQLARRANCH